MPKRIPGLYRQGRYWQIDKQIRGFGRLCESTGCCDLAEAEAYLTRRFQEIKDAILHGKNRARLFREGATRYLTDFRELPSIGHAAYHFKLLDDWIGDLSLDRVYDETLKHFVGHRMKAGVKRKTVNLSLGYVRRVLNLAARAWRDELTGKTWLPEAPLISMLPLTDQREPKPITWAQQRLLLPLLPDRNARMTLFALNTGARDGVVCALRWSWERQHDALPYSVFVVPREYVKGRKRDGVLVLNRVAQSIIEAQRGQPGDVVFHYRGKAVETMNNTAWQSARREAALVDPHLGDLHIHDLRHTVGERLRAAGVSEEDRADILWHTGGKSMTTHYSLARTGVLMERLNRIAEEPADQKEVPLSELLRKKSRKSPEAA